MRKDMDAIQFESREEVREILRILKNYTEKCPQEKENPTVKQLYNLLDVMEMEW